METLAVVLDANVLLSAAIRPAGPTHRLILTLLLSPRTETFIPRYLISEISPKLREIAERKGIEEERLASTLEALLAAFTMVDEYKYK